MNIMSQSVYAFLAHWNHWHWGLLAIVLTLLEWVFPRSLFLWLGISAGVVSGLSFLFPGMGWPVACLLWIAIAVLAARRSRVKKRVRRRQRRPAQARRTSQYVGRIYTLAHPIQNGVGLLEADRIVWTIYGLDMPVGTVVKVVGFEGSILSVEAMEQKEEI